jgi:hypothetical protein
MTWPAAAAPELPSDDDVYVLHGRPLRPGALLEQTPQLSDDIWWLNAAILQLHVPSWRLNFLTIPEQYRPAAKKVIYAMLSGTLPDGEQRRSISTIRSVFTELRRFLTWMDGRDASARRRSLAGVTVTDLQNYQRHLITTALTPRGRAFAQAAIGHLWRYRHALPAGEQLPFDPRRLDGWHQPWPRDPENTTERIPEAVLGPLLAWSMRFTTDFAPDILAACRQWHEYREDRPEGRARVPAAEICRQLAGRVARQQPLPGRNGKVNIYFLAKTLGCSRRTLDGLSAEIEAAAAAAGVTPWTCYELPVTGLIDGQPWITGIAAGTNNSHSLATLTRLLQASCYVIIVFLSGMRDSEVKHLRRGCLSVSRDADGRAYRWKIASLAFKGERDPAGTAATWVVGEPVARAIEVLGQLQPDGAGLLFTQLPYSGGTGPASGSPNLAPSAKTTSRQLNELAAWITGYCKACDRGDGIPPVSGQPLPAPSSTGTSASRCSRATPEHQTQGSGPKSKPSRPWPAVSTSWPSSTSMTTSS